MKFNIEVISHKPKKIWGLSSHEGRITISDELCETFAMPLTNWQLKDYCQQWQEGLERIKIESTLCLITVVQNLYTNPHVEMWTLYKEGSSIYFHNNLFNNEILAEDDYAVSQGGLDLTYFTPQTCYQFVDPKRITHTSDGDEISEWCLDIKDLFLK